MTQFRNDRPTIVATQEKDLFVILSKKRIKQLKALNKLIDHYRTEAAKNPKSLTLKDAMSLRNDLLREIADLAASAVDGVPTILCGEVTQDDATS
jgi:hypothetical protein